MDLVDLHMASVLLRNLQPVADLGFGFRNGTILIGGGDIITGPARYREVHFRQEHPDAEGVPSPMHGLLLQKWLTL